MSKGIVANSALNAAAGLSMLMIGFVCSIVTARLLGPEASGVIAFSLWLAVTISLLAELGTGITLLRMLPQLKGQGFSYADRRGFAVRLLRPVALATLVLLAGYYLYLWEAEREHWATGSPDVILVTAILIFVQSIGSFTKNYLIGEQRVDTFFKMASAAGALQLAGVVGGAVFFGIPGAIAGYVFGYVLQFVYALGILSGRARSCGIETRYLVGSSFILSLQLIIDSIFLSRIELFFLQQYRGVETVGYYAAALSLANLAVQLPVQLTGSLLPYYSEKLQSQGGGRLPVQIFEGVARSLAYITLPLSFGLAAISTRLVTAIFGIAFEPSGTILFILAVGTPAFIMSTVCTQYLFFLDLARERLVIGIVGAVLMTLGAFATVPMFGGEGAAAVRFVVFLVMSLLMLRKMEFEGSLRPLSMTIARVGIAAAACAGAAYLVLASIAGIAGLALAIIMGAVVYGLALRILRVLPEEDRQVLERIAGQLPPSSRGIANRVIALLIATPRSCERKS